MPHSEDSATPETAGGVSRTFLLKEKNMKKLFARSMGLVASLVVTGGMICMAPAAAWAQQKFKVSPPDPGAVTKYTEQHTFDVGDIAGHQIRIATLHTKNSDKAGEYDGVKAVEGTGWLASDYINGSGHFTVHNVVLMANGDKVYSRSEGISHTQIAADGARKTSTTSVNTITGGTGRFATLRGSTRATGSTDFKTGTNTASVEGEYWFDK
jgi:hypothetical protein